MEFTITYDQFLTEAAKFLQCSDRLRDEWERRSIAMDSVTKEHVEFLAKKCSMLCTKTLTDKPTQEEIEALIGIEAVATDDEDDQACVGSAVHTRPLSTTCAATTEVEGSPRPLILACEYHVIYSLSYQVPVLYFTVSYHSGKLVPLAELWELLPTGQVCSDNGKWGILTQAEHPLLFQPFYCLHPCNTAKAMGAVLRCLPSSAIMPITTAAHSSSSHINQSLLTQNTSSSTPFSSSDSTSSVPSSDSCPSSAHDATNDLTRESLVPRIISGSYLVTWLSMFGPVVGLRMSAEYSKSL